MILSPSTRNMANKMNSTNFYYKAKIKHGAGDKIIKTIFDNFILSVEMQ